MSHPGTLRLLDAANGANAVEFAGRTADLDVADLGDLDLLGASLAPLAIPPAPLHVERVSARTMIGHQVAWQDLCDRALEPNVFLEPAFALPLIQHGARTRRPDFLLIWEEDGPTSFGRLVGLFPVVSPSRYFPRIARGFFDDQVRLGTPLLDRERAAEVLEVLLDAVRRAMPDAATLRLTGIYAESPFAALLSNRCAAGGRALQRFGEHRRAALFATPEPTTNVMPFAHAKRRKEIKRQRRRLSEKGVRTYSSVETPDAVARATEQFLALEQRGWKGRRGTALLAWPPLATFTRSMTRMMAHEGKCRIDAIELDGKPVAMGIVLTIRDRAYFWKTAFHEAYRPLSPGVQFALELTERQLKDKTIALTDSCAVADHPMIDRLWSDRIAVTDVLVELEPGRPGRFARACRRERLARALRAKAKRLYHWLRRLRERR